MVNLTEGGMVRASNYTFLEIYKQRNILRNLQNIVIFLLYIAILKRYAFKKSKTKGGLS
jgi:uncharacterized membrane protein (DUF485 family)